MPSKPNKYRRGRRINSKKRKQQRLVRITGLCLACAVIIGGIVAFMLHRAVSKVPEDVICSGIYIGDVDVSSMKAEEAKAAVEAKVAEYSALTLDLKVEDRSAQATLGELGLYAENLDEQVQAAVDYGKKGNLFSRYWQMRKLKKEKKVLDLKYQVDSAMTEQLLTERVLPLEQEAVQATITRENGAFVITDEKVGLTLDMKKSIESICTYINEEWDLTAGSVEMVSVTDEPTVTREMLSTIKDKLGSFKTYCGDGQTRVTNIKVATANINGTVLMPGEEFSASDTMKPREPENGYVAAGQYENGEVVEAVGGGVCQVSTTLYNAVLNAELKVTQRSPHSMIVSYVKPSRDAAIAAGSKDFKFVNNLDNPIYIEGYVYDGNVYFNIYGTETRDAGRTIEFVSETLSTTEATKKYVESSDAELGKKKQVSSGHDGVEARLWKVVKQNGQQVSKDKVNSSSYRMSEAKIEVGTKSDNAQASALVKNAIATQDGAKIDAAIEQAKALVAAANNPATSAGSEGEAVTQ